MDRFSFFFAFYGLILGLAVAEILAGLGRFVRSRSTHQLGMQTALLAAFTFISITATWIDAFNSLQAIVLDFRSIWPPVFIATCYYLAATVIFPSDLRDLDQMDVYYSERKKFVVVMLFICELLATYNFLPLIVNGISQAPASFWLFYLPFHVFLKASYIGLFFAKSRRANMAFLSILIFLLLFSYWDNGVIPNEIQHRYGGLWSM